MRIEILQQARLDLIRGYHFYESQEAGLGSYFLTNLYSDIESLRLYAGIHSKPYKSYHAFCLADFLSRFSIKWWMRQHLSMPSWIVAASLR